MNSNIDNLASQLLASNRTERSRKRKRITEAFGGLGKINLVIMQPGNVNNFQTVTSPKMQSVTRKENNNHEQKADRFYTDK